MLEIQVVLIARMDTYRFALVDMVGHSAPYPTISQSYAQRKPKKPNQ